MASMIRLIEKTVAPTVTAGAYSANDVVGGVLTFDVSSASGVLLLKTLRIVDDGDVKAAGTLWLFNSAPTSFADNAAFAPVIADLKKVIGKVAVVAGDYTTVNGNAIALLEDQTDVFKVDGGTLYGYFVCSGTPTYGATTDLTITLSLLTE